MTNLDFSSMRAAMVDSQLRTSDVNDPQIVAAMARVAREAFVPAERRDSAYIDRPVSLGGGRWLNPPLVTGRLLTAAQVKADDRVLLIGSATGYAAALLSELAGFVVAVEEDAALMAQARAALAGHAKISFFDGPLAAGAAASAPFTLIVIDGAAEVLPAAIADQLAEGGRIVMAQLDAGITRLAAGRKVAGHVAVHPFADCEATVLPGFTKPSGFVF